MQIVIDQLRCSACDKSFRTTRKLVVKCPHCKFAYTFAGGEWFAAEQDRYPWDGANISDDKAYRYLLWRTWNARESAVVFIGLNPSTADARKNDPTIRRMILFAERWGFGGIRVVNLYALRTSDPRLLMQHTDPIGPENDRTIESVCRRNTLTVACWGANKASRRASELIPKLSEWCHDLRSLGTTKGGHPKHPLYLRSDTELQEFS